MRSLGICLLMVSTLLICSCGKQGDKSEAEVVVSPAEREVGSRAPIAKGEVSYAGYPVGSASDYICNDPRGACANPLIDAKDEKEAVWLMDNGYPSKREYADFSQMPIQQLKRVAEAGSKPAAAIYGRRVALDGNVQEGLDVLLRTAQSGSIYAYYEMSDVYQKSPAVLNIVDSAAYLRVAYLLGDSEAASLYGSRSLSAVESSVADERAMELYRSMAGQRVASPRPQ